VTEKTQAQTDPKALGALIEEAVDRGARSVEEIHRSIAGLPITVLERLGLFERTANEARRIQDVSIGAIYETIREVNHQVARLAGDLLTKAEEAGETRT
jgi:hypothetical protein